MGTFPMSRLKTRVDFSASLTASLNFLTSGGQRVQSFSSDGGGGGGGCSDRLWFRPTLSDGGGLGDPCIVLGYGPSQHVEFPRGLGSKVGNSLRRGASLIIDRISV
jgi:hypothetical protein